MHTMFTQGAHTHNILSTKLSTKYTLLIRHIHSTYSNTQMCIHTQNIIGITHTQYTRCSLTDKHNDSYLLIFFVLETSNDTNGFWQQLMPWLRDIDERDVQMMQPRKLSIPPLPFGHTDIGMPLIEVSSNITQ